MTMLLNPTAFAHTRFAENDIALGIIALFEAFPELAGFTVEERAETVEGEWTPSVGNVRFASPLREDKRAEVCEGIRAALADMARDRPAMAEWLGGRTYNR